VRIPARSCKFGRSPAGGCTPSLRDISNIQGSPRPTCFGTVGGANALETPEPGPASLDVCVSLCLSLSVSLSICLSLVGSVGWCAGSSVGSCLELADANAADATGAPCRIVATRVGFPVNVPARCLRSCAHLVTVNPALCTQHNTQAPRVRTRTCTHARTHARTHAHAPHWSSSVGIDTSVC
jgi:hypothetical protein